MLFFEKSTPMIICLAAIGLVGAEVNQAQAVNLRTVANYNSELIVEGVTKVRDDWEADGLYTQDDLTGLIGNSFTQNSVTTVIPNPVEITNFQGSSFSVPISQVLNGIIPDGNSGQLIGRSSDGQSSAAIYWGANTLSDSNQLEYSFNYQNAQINGNASIDEGGVSKVFSVRFTPDNNVVTTPEPTSILGLLIGSFFGAVLWLKHKQVQAE